MSIRPKLAVNLMRVEFTSEIIDELYGSVEINPESPNYLGALYGIYNL